MDRTSISLCMIVKNEEKFLENCLKSVNDIVQEIIICDTGSTDNTISIAKKFNATIIETKWKNDFSNARNLSIEKATGHWILFLDADEELSSGSKQEILKWAAYPDADAYFVKVINYLHHKGGDATVNPTIRMFLNKKEHRFSGTIHEQIADSIQAHNQHAKFVMTDIKIDHYGYHPSVREQKNKTERNIKLLEAELKKDPNHAFHLYNIGIEYLQSGKVLEALESFRNSIKNVHPGTNYTHLLYKCESRCLSALNRLQEAIDCCNHAIKLFPNYTDLYHYRGTYHLALGELQEAKKSFYQAFTLGEATNYHTEAGIGSYSSSYLYGLVCESLSEDDQAIEYYMQSYLLNPSFTRGLYRAFQLYRLTNRESELYEMLIRTFKLRHKQQRIKIMEVALRTHCYKSANSLVDYYLEYVKLDKDEQSHYKRLMEDFSQLVCSSTKDKFNENQMLPVEEIQTFSNILNNERHARILYAQGAYKAFQDYLKTWKSSINGSKQDPKIMVHSHLQMVLTLSYTTEQHLRTVQKEQYSSNLLHSAISSLPFEEGIMEVGLDYFE